MMGERRERRRKQRGEGRRLEGGRQRAGRQPDPSEQAGWGPRTQTSSHWYPRQLPTEAVHSTCVPGSRSPWEGSGPSRVGG